MVIDGNPWTTMLRIPDSYDAKTDNYQVFVIVCVSKTDRWFGKRARKPQNRAQNGKRTIQPNPGVVLFVRLYEHNVFFFINARLRDPKISIIYFLLSVHLHCLKKVEPLEPMAFIFGQYTHPMGSGWPPMGSWRVRDCPHVLKVQWVAMGLQG